ncbi:hypothetical protein COO60DRAFT_1555581 [Scenedesmus sp. NREL 46B-D3]|nr:hypothetical protein COO60DRAFT_1555581 [Scenedesmus sp. NREL 46B-D3]
MFVFTELSAACQFHVFFLPMYACAHHVTVAVVAIAVTHSDLLFISVHPCPILPLTAVPGCVQTQQQRFVECLGGNTCHRWNHWRIDTLQLTCPPSIPTSDAVLG